MKPKTHFPSSFEREIEIVGNVRACRFCDLSQVAAPVSKKQQRKRKNIEKNPQVHEERRRLTPKRNQCNRARQRDSTMKACLLFFFVEKERARDRHVKGEASESEIVTSESSRGEERRGGGNDRIVMADTWLLLHLPCTCSRS